ncbi:MAG: dehydrogenase [Rhodoglobus sp.]
MSNEFRSEQLASALEAQDVAAVAFALRNHMVAVPLLPSDGSPQVRVFRRGEADSYMLLLFSSLDSYRLMLPEEVDLVVAAYDRESLRDFLAQNIGVLESVWFDVAGPHAMQAVPQDVLDALELTAE